jgi:hypothetical protein
MSGTRRARPRRLASNGKVKQEEGTEDRMSVPQETVDKMQSYAFRPTGKRKDYKSEETSEGRRNYPSTPRRRFFHSIGTSISRKEWLCLSSHWPDENPLLTNNTEESKPPRKRKSSTADAASPRKKQKAIQMELDKPHPEPANWRAVYEKIEKMRSQIIAPVDTMGCHTPMLEEGEPRVCLSRISKERYSRYQC